MTKCIFCNGEVRPLEDFFKLGGEENYQEMKDKWKEVMGIEWKESEHFNCIECGKVYNKDMQPTGYNLGWALRRLEGKNGMV